VKYKMALPRLNDKPKYDLIIPSTEQKVRFRPYLVKEEKVLMMAMETKDQKQALNAVVDTILACVDENLDKQTLKVFDIEYMFLMIRSKSVGESSEINIKCDSCEEMSPCIIHLDDIPVPKMNHDGNIKISDEINLDMNYPVWLDMLDMDDSKSETEQTFDLIAACMQVLSTPETRYEMKDESKEEIQNFIDSLSSNQFEHIKDFIEEMPRLEKTETFICAGCGKENTVTLRGLDDFF